MSGLWNIWQHERLMRAENALKHDVAKIAHGITKGQALLTELRIMLRKNAA